MQRLTHYKRSDLLEFKISFSVRDLLAPKGRAVKDQVEALVQAVQKAGSYRPRKKPPGPCTPSWTPSRTGCRRTCYQAERVAAGEGSARVCAGRPRSGCRRSEVTARRPKPSPTLRRVDSHQLSGLAL